ncbi:AAA family ATPase [Streptomyces sp. NPDC006012]|uniref:AAA family ATPase n=1 Tax=Streptomyces sp. NPDC006012 TaxID=3364739 RepID=UPI0036B1D582
MERRTADGAADLVPVRSPRMVGRGTELERIVQALARAPATVLIEGEAGVGKSRLLQEALRVPAVRARGPLVAACPPFKEALTLQPVVDAVRQARAGLRDLELTTLAGALRPLFPEWAHELPRAPELLDDAGAARHRLFRALGRLGEGSRAAAGAAGERGHQLRRLLVPSPRPALAASCSSRATTRPRTPSPTR